MRSSRVTDPASLLIRYRESKLTQRAFAESEGITAHTLQYWLKKERDESQARGSSFFKLPVDTTSITDSPAVIEIVTSNGTTIRIPA